MSGTVDDFLVELRKSSSWLEAFKFNAYTDVVLRYLDNRPPHQAYELQIARSGSDFVLTGDYIVFSRQTENLDRSLSDSIQRLIVDGRYFTHQTDLGKPKSLGATSEDLEKHMKGILMSSYSTFALEGFVHSNGGMSLFDIISSTPYVESTSTTWSGFDCIAVKAITKYGTIQLFLAKDHGHALCGFVCEKDADDYYTKRETIADQPPLPSLFDGQTMVGLKLEMYVDMFEKVDGTDVASAGRLREETVLSEGRNLLATYEFARTNIALGVDAVTAGDFVVDLQQGARVANWDHPDSPVMFTWDSGQLSKFGADVALPSVEPVSSARYILIFANLLAFVFASCWCIWRYVKARQSTRQ